MNLQSLFAEPIIEVEELAADYDDHASDVWRVQTITEDVIVRASRISAEGVENHSFFSGVKELFGVEPYHLSRLVTIYKEIERIGALAVPRIFRVGQCLDRTCIVVERMPGARLASFCGLPDAVLQQLGKAVARHHAQTYPLIGQIDQSWGYPLREFPIRLAQAMARIACQYYAGDSELHALLPVYCERALALSPPQASSPILVDFYPGQFLRSEDHLGALVDAEVVVAGPPELELVILEYLLDEAAAVVFRTGYESVRKFPDIDLVRDVYRFFIRLIGVHGSMPIAQALQWPEYL